MVGVVNTSMSQKIIDESRFRHPTDQFTSLILRFQSSDDVTARILSEDISDIHSNVDRIT